MQKKKSAVDLTDMAIGIVILGMVVTIGALILLNLRDNRLTDLDVITTSNETLSSVTEAGVGLTNQWVQTVTRCTNATGGEIIPTTNYTTSISTVDGAGTITAVGAGAYNNTDWNCTYDYYNTTSRADYDLASNASTGMAEYGNWFDIVVLVGIAGLILALIFLAFGGRGSSYEGGVSY